MKDARKPKELDVQRHQQQNLFQSAEWFRPVHVEVLEDAERLKGVRHDGKNQSNRDKGVVLHSIFPGRHEEQGTNKKHDKNATDYPRSNETRRISAWRAISIGVLG